MRVRVLLGWTAVVLATACATSPRPGQPDYPYNVDGAYTGLLVVEDERFGAELELSTAGGGNVAGTFRVGPPFEIDGRVIGVVFDQLLRLTVTYRSSTRAGCNGQIEGILTIEVGGGVIEGPVTVADCGDRIAGRISFRRP